MSYMVKLLTLLACWLSVVSAQPVSHHGLDSPSAQESLLERKLGKSVERFDTSGRPLIASVLDLAYKYELPTALEYVDREITARTIDLQFHHQTVRAVLAAIIQQIPEYGVSFSGGIVDIYAPKAREDASNLLNKVIKDFAVTDLDTHQADLALFCALAREVGPSGGCGGSIAVGQWAPLKITLHMQNAKAYEILNAIVAQNGKALWTPMVPPEKLSKVQFGGLWYIYPLEQPFKTAVWDRLTTREVESLSSPRHHPQSCGCRDPAFTRLALGRKLDFQSLFNVNS